MLCKPRDALKPLASRFDQGQLLGSGCFHDAAKVLPKPSDGKWGQISGLKILDEQQTSTVKVHVKDKDSLTPCIWLPYRTGQTVLRRVADWPIRFSPGKWDRSNFGADFSCF